MSDFASIVREEQKRIASWPGPLHSLIANIPCRFAERGCRSLAARIAYVPEGCHCWPDPVQALCEQHWITAESKGPIVEIATVESP